MLNQKWLIILGILLFLLLGTTGLSTYKLIQANDRAEALEAASNIYEKDLQVLQAEKLDLIDSIEVVKKSRSREIEVRDQKIEDVLAYVDEILNSIPKNDSAVDALPEEEIDDLHKQYYPNEETAKKDAVKNARRVATLEVAIQQQGIVISEQAKQITDLRQQLTDTELQNDLQRELNHNLQTQLEAEKAKKPKDNTLAWIFRCIGVFATGYVAASISN